MERCRKGGIETKPSTIKTLEAVSRCCSCCLPRGTCCLVEHNLKLG
uniref:Uncharacterized protein n=1 Tax=Heterorhabditis bacteriophora TaxID=37862 RepID=A0A1I7XBW5_HETBA